MLSKVLYIRNFANKVNPKSYNLQEIGFGKALIKKGFDCDVIYFDNNNKLKIEEVFQFRNNKLRILWMNGMKFLNNGIFTKVLRKKFLDEYDLIITTEYNQIMTFFLSNLCPEKLVLYHGPYGDNSNKKIQLLYDSFFLPRMRKNIKLNFSKSDLANNYLMKKGFKDVITLGVGLDTEHIDERINLNKEIESKLEKVKDKKVLLYIGVLEERRNISFLLNILKNILTLNNEIRLIIVGTGREDDTKKYWNFIKSNNLEESIIYFDKIEQRDLWRIYESSDVMLFPTNYDIFGMVLLESMHFQVPIISSVNGGSSTLIQHNINGLIIDKFDVSLWISEIQRLLNDSGLIAQIKQAAAETVREATWDHIAERMLMQIKH
ncbi:glycosyltransferase family 4 protein [Paenibacillus sp. EC2-1]|uniref:glycosyltransferase family 4 protein n=1 Tax=Paenibacillus sp. EC2-1 TaxID=3388665 RepID=UPI003BEF0546